MTIGLVGHKVGMTRVFTEDGTSIPVTVIGVSPNRVTQIKTVEVDGYNAIQITYDSKKQSKVNKPAAGHFAKANVEPGKGLCEFRIPELDIIKDIQLGSEITVDIFKEGQYIDVSGTSKGKGFAGTIKRHNFAGQDRSHGNSLSHRVPGSIGQNQSPGKVFKGKKMAGQLGNKRCTVQSQVIVRVDVERHLLLIKGVVPGAIGGQVIVKPAVKRVITQEVTDGA